MAVVTCKWCKSWTKSHPHSVIWPFSRFATWGTVLFLFVMVIMLFFAARAGTMSKTFFYLAGSLIAILAFVDLGRYIRRNAIGHRYYVFFDSKDELHIHDRLFTGGYAGNDPVPAPNFIQGYVLAVWSGGWDRDNEVLCCERNFLHPINPEAAPEAGEYKATNTWHILRVRFKFSSVQDPTVLFTDSLGEPPAFSYHGSLEIALGQMNEHGGYSELKRRVVVAESLRDELGILIVGVLEQIADMRTTLGRSQHAKAIRERLESGLATMSEQSSEWKSLTDLWREEYRHRQGLRAPNDAATPNASNCVFD